jgi:hypothetical protein
MLAKRVVWASSTAEKCFPFVIVRIMRTIMVRPHGHEGGTMNVLIIGAVLGLLIWGLMSGNGVIRILTRILTGGLTLLSLAGMIFLFGVGQKAHWTSDGPGMLFIMIGVVACGFFAFLFGNLTLLTSPPQNSQPPLSFSELIRSPSHKEKGRPSE